ncbi:signal transduction histidine kinase [Pseudarthrobacter sp. W1I19]|uniref:ATP-binding response regulator n=1 Tax=Pseudarthrobacter sp. W1I19 TaxID=3042288 RepID=UPI002783F741|nr:response regulator [Pseudarthrobacter sp. W1I19]MDQ0921855.1 signal transduction histidine kinase [Pseudarthrobacter sp. W1I19]
MAVASNMGVPGGLDSPGVETAKLSGLLDDSGAVMTVLVVDDDEGSLLVAKAAVEKSGHKCILAADGDTAWRLYQERRPHVVVSDLMMPGLNGLDLCRAIRAAETSSYTYVMLLTSHGAQEDVLEGMRAGADDYVAKPLDPFVLRTRLLAARRVTALHAALANALDETRESNERLAEFTGRVSHDLRTPLTSILGYVELAGMDAESGQTEDTAEYLEIIGSSARRLLSMVEELLGFASIGGSLSRTRLSLAGLVKEVTEDLSLGLREAGAAVHCQDLIFDADESQLRVAVQNLIQNAVAYRRPDVPPVIRVSGERAGAGVVIRVEDNGKGIREGDRRRVVEPLVRLHREGDPAGTGLGLATCARIAAAHGGRLEISPSSSGGTTVSIYLGVL